MRHKCQKEWCGIRCGNKREMQSHSLLEHPDDFNFHIKATKRKWNQIQSKEMKSYYDLMKKENISKVQNVSKPLNIYKRRKLNKKFEPSVVDSLKYAWSKEH